MTANKPFQSATQRMLIILAMLRAAPSHTLSSTRFLAVLPDYIDGDESGRRLYRHDLKTLKDRNLVTPGRSTKPADGKPGIGNRKAVQLCYLDKSKDWQLSVVEHAALRQARHALRQWSGGAATNTVPVTSGPIGRGGETLDLLTRAIRILEEHGEVMSLRELSDELGERPGVVLMALQEVDFLEVGPKHDVRMPGLEIPLSDEGEQPELLVRDQDPDLVRVKVSRSTDLERPLFGYGLDVLGQFAYTAEETQERLDLIGKALEVLSDGVDGAALGRASEKLRHWATYLEENGFSTLCS